MMYCNHQAHRDFLIILYFILQQVLQNYLFTVHTTVIKTDTQIYFLKQLYIFI